MSRLTKIKEWLNENAPMLNVVYQNKYVGMASDRFASLPPRQQKQIILGVLGGFTLIVFGYVLISYLSLWSLSSKTEQAYRMVTLLQQHQRTQRAQSDQISVLERNNELSSPGQFKEHLSRQALASKISARMVKVDEMAEGSPGGEEGKAGEVRIKQATVRLERVTLSQLTQFLRSIEFGPFNLSVSSIKVTNDDKLRGYMNVEIGVVAYLFSAEAG